MDGCVYRDISRVVQSLVRTRLGFLVATSPSMGNTPTSLFGPNIAEAHKGYESKYKGWERFCPVPHVRNGGGAADGENDKTSDASSNIASAESNDSSSQSKCPVMRKEEKVSPVAAE